MALQASHNETTFGVGDLVRISQRIKEGDKSRLQVFEGMVIAIKNRDLNKSMTVRRIGANQIGIERIFPIAAPTIEKVEVVKKGMSGTHRAKLYYTRDKSRREVDQIYARASKRERVALEQKTAKPKAKTAKNAAKSPAKKASKKK